MTSVNTISYYLSSQEKLQQRYIKNKQHSPKVLTKLWFQVVSNLNTFFT